MWVNGLYEGVSNKYGEQRMRYTSPKYMPSWIGIAAFIFLSAQFISLEIGRKCLKHF